MGVMPCCWIAATFLFTISSVSPKISRRSLWPTTTYSTFNFSQKDRRHFASERTAVFPVTVLSPDLEVEVFALDQRLHTPDVRERRVNAHVDLLKDVLWQQVVQLLHGLDGLEVVEVHLPVA